MAIIAVPQAQAEDRFTYTSSFLKWKGFIDRIPVLDSIISANAAAVSSSWRTFGRNAKTMKEVLNGVTGNGKQTFKQLMNNALMVAKIGGDCYMEIITDSDLNISNIVMLPADNIKQNIKNGQIKSYEEIDGGSKWRPLEILHFAYNSIGAMTHGRSVIEPMQNILIDYLQILDTGQKIYEHYVKPREIYYADTDDPAKLSELSDLIRKTNAVPKSALVLPKGTVELQFQMVSGGILSPRDWVRVLLDNIVMSSRVPELALGTGTVNSEESAKIQFEGFRQMVRWDQQWMEETLQLQLFMLQYPDHTPNIEFSFAAEPQEERFNRMMSAFSAVGGSQLPENIKVLTQLKLLQEAGVIEDV